MPVREKGLWIRTRRKAGMDDPPVRKPALSWDRQRTAGLLWCLKPLAASASESCSCGTCAALLLSTLVSTLAPVCNTRRLHDFKSEQGVVQHDGPWEWAAARSARCRTELPGWRGCGQAAAHLLAGGGAGRPGRGARLGGGLRRPGPRHLRRRHRRPLHSAGLRRLRLCAPIKHVGSFGRLHPCRAACKS